MKAAVIWTLGGDFQIVDEEDENAPLAELKLFEPLRSMAIEEPEEVAQAILTAMVETPHPYAQREEIAS